MLFTCDNLAFGYLDSILFRDVTLSMNEGDRIGLIGPNGVGKTTFLRILLGELVPTEGVVTIKKGLRIGVLRQKDGLEGTGSVWQEMQSAFHDLHEAEAKMREIEGALADEAEGSLAYRNLTAEHTKLENYILSRDGYHTDVRVKTVLSGMGFGDRCDMPVSLMSGGEKTRLALCKLLLCDLDLLVLDEPTNHLDIATLQWLEEYLSTYKGGLLIVSHDRYFLDKIVSKIWDMDGGTVREWRGNYSKATATKEQWVAATEKLYDKQQAQVAAMLDYAQRNIARASTSKSAKSRLHRIEGMDLVDKPITYTKPPRFHFGIEGESNKDVLCVTDMALSIAGKPLVADLSFAVNKGDRLAIVGPNGIGKSTLVKTLLGLVNTDSDHYNVVPDPRPSACVGGARALRPLCGAVRYGKNVSISYYDQENINLDSSACVLDELWFRFPRYTQTYVRSILANMLFDADDMTKSVASLSGGEKAKLGFALIMCENSNVLLLDEPTNHLDLAAREALEKALCAYEGTVIFVSHDRYFVNAVATRVLELTLECGVQYVGNYDAYLAEKARVLAAKREQEEAQNTPTSPAKENKNTSYRTKEEKRQAAQKREETAKIEKELVDIEGRMAQLNELMCAGTGDYRDFAVWDQELQQLSLREEELYNRLAELE